MLKTPEGSRMHSEEPQNTEIRNPVADLSTGTINLPGFKPINSLIPPPSGSNIEATSPPHSQTERKHVVNPIEVDKKKVWRAKKKEEREELEHKKRRGVALDPKEEAQDKIQNARKKLGALYSKKN